jgi:transposase
MEQMAEARALYESGVDMWSLSKIYGVHYETMRKYLRQFELYGESIYTSDPQYVEKTED